MTSFLPQRSTSPSPSPFTLFSEICISMSQNPRPRIVINGGVRGTRTFHYYWCRICRRIVRISFGNPVEILISCPFCSRQLRHELDVARAGINAGLSDLQHNTAQLPAPRAGYYRNGTDSRRTVPRWGSETDDGPFPESWITLHFIRPGVLSENSNAPVNRRRLPPADPNRASMGEMAENMSRSDPPPRPVYGIEAIPTVKITENHLEKDSNCPVCKEDFRIGGEVRQLQCNHFYHSDCIVPWLRLHNTCPVCRHRLHSIAPAAVSDLNGGNVENLAEEVVSGRWNDWWSVVCSWWPIRTIADWTRRLRFADSPDSVFIVERKIIHILF